MRIKKAFTLAEIMIVLTIIGILSAILLPVAFQSTPDENVMKFKKANSTLGTVVRELVTSDKYYINGDLGMASRTVGGSTLLTNGNLARELYFCQTMADMMSVSSINSCTGTVGMTTTGAFRFMTAASASLGTAIRGLDLTCNTATTNIAQFTTTDNITWYDPYPSTTFGMSINATDTNRQFTEPTTIPIAANSENGFDIMYKIFCFDIDGIGTGESPFGYGIRADGKILYGERAQEWSQRSIQNND